MRIAVIAVGSPFGDDAAGLAVLKRLIADGLPGDIETHESQRPMDLVELLQSVDAAVLIDATVSGREPGTVRELGLCEIDRTRVGSTHGIGIAEALDLLGSLGRRPERISLVGIEAQRTTGNGLSRAVRRNLDAAATLARARCDQWRSALQHTPRVPRSTRNYPHA